MTTPPPTALDVSRAGLTVHWHDRVLALPAALLRTRCRCADCLSAALRGMPLNVEAPLALVDAVPLGHYAVQLRFSDGHERGIYPWVYLREMADAEAGASDASA